MAEKILIVEDDQFTRELYEETLKAEGFEVVTAADGEQGLLLASRGGYSLILLDLMLPRMSGLEVLKALKIIPLPQSNGPILVLTNLENDPVVTETQSAGAAAVYVKTSFNTDQLISIVQKHLGTTTPGYPSNSGE